MAGCGDRRLSGSSRVPGNLSDGNHHRHLPFAGAEQKVLRDLFIPVIRADNSRCGYYCIDKCKWNRFQRNADSGIPAWHCSRSCDRIFMYPFHAAHPFKEKIERICLLLFSHWNCRNHQLFCRIDGRGGALLRDNDQEKIISIKEAYII